MHPIHIQPHGDTCAGNNQDRRKSSHKNNGATKGEIFMDGHSDFQKKPFLSVSTQSIQDGLYGVLFSTYVSTALRVFLIIMSVLCLGKMTGENDFLYYTCKLTWSRQNLTSAM